MGCSLCSGGCGILNWERGLFFAFVDPERSFKGVTGVQCGYCRGVGARRGCWQ